MNRSLPPDARKQLLVLVASCWLGFAAVAGQSTGETSAAAATSVGSTATRITGAAADRPLVMTSGSALTVFAPGVFPAGLSNDGDVLLSTADGLQRWKAGRSEPLQIPDTGNFTVEGMNRNGAILGSSSRNANPGFSCLSTQRGWYWAPGQSVATEINNPFTFSGYDECANKNTDVRQFNPRVLDPANRIWANIPYLADPGNNSAFQGLHRWDAPGAAPVQVGYHGPLPAGPYIELADVNAAGVMVGLRLRHGVAFAEYFVGDQPVDFQPFAINDAGQVLGYDGVSAILSNAGTDVFLQLLYPDLLNSRGDVAGRFFGLPVLLPGSVALGGTTDYTEHLLQNLLPAGWTPLQITGLNDAGAVTGFGFYTDPEKPDEPAQVLGFLLVPAALRVDFDRNGEISVSSAADNPDLELARQKMPWFFWVNDDNDADETDGNDIPGGGNNGRDGKVNGTRDLVDFFPVHLDIAGLLKAYPASDPAITYKLTQAKGAANFIITDLNPATAGRYHRDAEYAKELGATPVTQITAAGATLGRAFLDKILNQNEGGIILVEAREATNQPLRLEVWRNNVPVSSLELPLSFAGVETMFRHVNLVGAVGMKEETGPRGFLPNWSEKLEDKQAFLFVHGYNVNQKQARGWQAEIFKRLWWSGSRAQFWGVTWYGYESQVPGAHFTPNYQLNVIHAFGTAPIFKQFLDELRVKTGVSKVNVAAHSLGNLVVSSAISDHDAPIDRFFMINAAVAAEAYDGEKGVGHVVQPDDSTAFLPHTEWNKERGKVYPPRLWASNWYELFLTPVGNPATDDARAMLTWRDRFAPQSKTDYYDFHSTGEEVLGYDERHTENTPSLLGVLATEIKTYLHITKPGELRQPNGYQTWIYQEQLKGRTTTGKVLGSNYGGWGFNNFILKKTPTQNGRGPRLAPVDMTPEDAIAAEPYFLDIDLQAEPFFRPGGYWTRVGSWKYDPLAKINYWINGPLRQLYAQSTGSAFASVHRDTLLARMIPAMSPAAGRIPVPRLTTDAGEERNFDMHGNDIRPRSGPNPPWPLSRPTPNWWHSDLREVAYPYVRRLYERMVDKGSLKGGTP